MTVPASSPLSVLEMGDAEARYEPGVCNIGPAEIAMRRRAGHAALATTVALIAGLHLRRAPRRAWLIVALPAAAAASGYLQSRLRFCAGFGSRGVYNFGELGSVVEAADPAARARDRAMARRIGLASAAIGGLVGVVAAGASRA